jgi:hypothetical protein
VHGGVTGGSFPARIWHQFMQGALTAMRAPVTVDRLDPFVEPDLCVAHLAPAPTRDRASS